MVIAARICPNDVRLTLQQAIPGGMSLQDYSQRGEVIAAIREGLPEADQLQPGAVFQHAPGALRNCPNDVLKRTGSIAPMVFRYEFMVQSCPFYLICILSCLLLCCIPRLVAQR